MRLYRRYLKVLALDERQAETAIEQLKIQLAEAALQEMSARIRVAADAVALELADPLIQKIDNVDSLYEINNSEARLTFKIFLGELVGKYTQRVRQFKRKNHEVRPHKRDYDGKRPWQLSDGSWIVLDRIPDELFKSEIKKRLGL